jgi:hypothetical protein
MCVPDVIPFVLNPSAPLDVIAPHPIVPTTIFGDPVNPPAVPAVAALPDTLPVKVDAVELAKVVQDTVPPLTLVAVVAVAALPDTLPVKVDAVEFVKVVHDTVPPLTLVAVVAVAALPVNAP